jgi:hypothetical protein
LANLLAYHVFPSFSIIFFQVLCFPLLLLQTSVSLFTTPFPFHSTHPIHTYFLLFISIVISACSVLLKSSWLEITSGHLIFKILIKYSFSTFNL